MIWIPKKEDCLIWNETEQGIYIFYCIDGNNTREFPIQFFWKKNYDKEYDPFYLSVEECLRDEVLNCPLSNCSSKPQLRYNKIINKWFCCCPSSALSTKNDDQDEIDSKLIDLNKVSFNIGYYDNPIEAILKWNETVGEDFVNIARSNIKKFEKWKKNVDCN